MKRDFVQALRDLGGLKVSTSFKTAVLASVVSIQGKQIRALKKRAAILSRVVPGVRGRRMLSPEPSGFSAGQRRGRLVSQRYYLFGGESDEYETAHSEVRTQT